MENKVVVNGILQVKDNLHATRSVQGDPLKSLEAVYVANMSHKMKIKGNTATSLLIMTSFLLPRLIPGGARMIVEDLENYKRNVSEVIFWVRKMEKLKIEKQPGSSAA